MRISLRSLAVLVAALVAALFAAACAPAEGPGPTASPPPDAAGSLDGGGDTPATPPSSASAHYAGVFEADTPLDFTQDGVLPGLSSPLLAALAELHDDPGDGLVDFASAAGVSAIAELGPVGQGLLAGLITDAMGELEAEHPELDRITALIEGIFAVAASGVLDNQLTLHQPDASGRVQVELAVDGMTFTMLGTTVSLSTPAARLAGATTSLMATLTPHDDAPIADADLTLAGGSLAIPVGDFVLQALGPLLLQPEFGAADLDAALLSLVPCQALADDVAAAAQGVALLDDVITPSLMDAACTAALTYAAAQVTNALSGLAVRGVTLSNGAATLYDVSPARPIADDQSDHLVGTWTWNFGAVAVPASFAGDRVAAAQ